MDFFKISSGMPPSLKPAPAHSAGAGNAFRHFWAQVSFMREKYFVFSEHTICASWDMGTVFRFNL